MAIGDGVSAIATLTVTFGGFSPTVMDGVAASKEQVERIEAENARKREAAKRARELQLARTSSEKTWDDGAGCVWTYVVIDKRFVRIQKCESYVACVSIPSKIDGLPVYALYPDFCADQQSIEEIVCPDTIEQIGSCAFRDCVNLKRLKLPSEVSEYKSTWVLGCEVLEEMFLPGLLDEIDFQVFEARSLKKLHVGTSVRGVQPGAFEKANLDELTVDPGNPFLKTDGYALYSIDGGQLVAFARNVESYTVEEGCKAIGRKAFNGKSAIKQVVVPEGLEVLDAFAFAHSGLRDFKAPSSLTTIGEKAFFHCKQLRSVSLNDGLEEIQDSAFRESGLESLHIPASIRHIGTSITMATKVVHRGEGCTLTIDEASELLFLDGNGGLYRHDDDGIHLIQLMDREAEEYTSMEGCAVINEHALSHHDCIRKITIAYGTRIIEDNAFRFSTHLEQVVLPDSIERIGKNAFLDTSLTSFTVPRNCTYIGETALVTSGAHHGEEVPSLRHVSVAEGNDIFFVTCGMLCKHADDGDHVIVFANDADRVVFPESIVRVEPYAFNNANGIAYLSLNRNLKTIGSSGLTTWCWIEHIHVDAAEAQEGRHVFDFMFPNTPKSKHGISIGIGGASWVYVPGIFAQYDICVINAHDYNTPNNPDNIPIYDQVTRVIERLQDPILLSDFNRSLYERMLRNYICEICVDIARHDDRAMIDTLVDLGFLNENNLDAVIEAVGRLQDAAMTGYLLEMKRRRYGRVAMDFDL